MCSREETFTHLFTLYLPEMSLELWQRGGRLAGGQAECMQSVQSIGQVQRCEVGVCVAGQWFGLVCKDPLEVHVSCTVIHKCKWHGLP